MSTENPTPRERIEAGFAAGDAHHADAAMQRSASQHRPEDDDEADRLAGIAAKVPISPVTRMQLGLHSRAKAAAALVAEEATS